MFRKKSALIAGVFIVLTHFYACTDIKHTGGEEIDAQVEITATPVFGKAPLTILFNAGKSLDQNGGKLSFLWNFDDGSISTARSPKHTFNVMGTYMVSFTVIRPDGLRDDSWTTVIVN